MSAYFVDKTECALHGPFPGVQMSTACGQQMTLSVVEMKPRASIPAHSHPHEQVGILLEGDGVFDIGDESCRVTPGMMWRIPGGTVHSIVAGESGLRALDVFYPIREDYR
ncbi:MAG TPA: cupin domain-containing protein [Pirellulales bacterium]|jgi:quercetin dioxygenase-like cupin family protein|nr:cupin domain-containing protein [Pirellulales bacterium]